MKNERSQRVLDIMFVETSSELQFGHVSFSLGIIKIVISSDWLYSILLVHCFFDTFSFLRIGYQTYNSYLF